VSVPPAPYLKAQQQPPDGVAPTLAAGATATLNLALDALLPFDGCPECVVSFVAAAAAAAGAAPSPHGSPSPGGTAHRYPLRLPVVAPCFGEPVPLSADDFAARWAALAPSHSDDPACPREQVGVGGVGCRVSVT
jgi:hypothetical protein